MIYFYKILRIATYTVFAIFLGVAFYYTILIDYFASPDKSKIEKYKIAVSSVVYDIEKKPLYYLFDSQFRFYTNTETVNRKILRLLFDKDFLSAFLPEFYKENSIKNLYPEDAYKNHLLKEIYFLGNTLKSRMMITKLRKNLSDFDFTELIINNLKFSENIYGLETISYYLFNKRFSELNDSEIIYCLANIDFYSQSNILKIDFMKEKYLNLKSFVNKKYKDDFVFSDSEVLTPEMQDIDFKQNEGYLNNLDAGISYELMLYYLKDYLINHKNFIDLSNNGYKIYSSYDLNFLKKILAELGVTGVEKSNKICVVYYNENDANYLLGIINLPYGKKFSGDAEKLGSSMRYNNKPITLLVLPILRYSYIDLYGKNKSGVIPVVKNE
ncbi:MAG TPA: hypothetical protein PKY81_13650 [bacterium]|nr:hypothetical protein [bacterium]HPN31993.1 hypothetical protein [bacterium]